MKVRTIKECIRELKENDPNNCLAEHALRQMIIQRKNT